jgi:hypothetical protein
VIAAGDIVFSSVTPKYDYGLYRIGVAAVGGTPTKLVDRIGMHGGFATSTAVVTTNFDSIVRIDLGSGTVTTIACGDTREHGILHFSYDGSTIFYARGAGKDQGEELRSVPFKEP